MFIPTSQSALLLARVDRYRASYSLPSFSCLKPSFIATSSIDEIQSLLIFFLQSDYSYTSLKINSPSRPASHALITVSTSLEFISFLRVLNCPLVTFTTSYLYLPGIIGKSSNLHLHTFHHKQLGLTFVLNAQRISLQYIRLLHSIRSVYRLHLLPWQYSLQHLAFHISLNSFINPPFLYEKRQPKFLHLNCLFIFSI